MSKNCWLYAAELNRLAILEVALKHRKEHGELWCPTLAGIAAAAGHARFLMRIFEEGCPKWSSACDGVPYMNSCRAYVSLAVHESQETSTFRCVMLDDWTLVVSPDLVRSDPVLLYAAEMGAPLTAGMEGMLGEVRGRALALAGCFRVAARLSREPGPHARKWAAMCQVPLEIIQDISNLAKISIVVRKLVA